MYGHVRYTVQFSSPSGNFVTFDNSNNNTIYYVVHNRPFSTLRSNRFRLSSESTVSRRLFTTRTNHGNDLTEVENEHNKLVFYFYFHTLQVCSPSPLSLPLFLCVIAQNRPTYQIILCIPNQNISILSYTYT